MAGGELKGNGTACTRAKEGKGTGKRKRRVCRGLVSIRRQ